MKVTGQITSSLMHDVLTEIEQFEEEERRYRAMVEEQRRKKAAWEKLKDADIAADRLYRTARAEHAFLLRCEGLTLRQIGERIDLTPERVRMIIYTFGRRVRRAMVRKWPRGRTRFYFEVSQ